MWKAIQRWWLLVSNRLSFEIGNGHRVKFCSNIWCKATPLCDPSFPPLLWQIRRRGACESVRVALRREKVGTPYSLDLLTIAKQRMQRDFYLDLVNCFG